jgi:ectoine hydroxylase-related dioxygenase (phytanoyl-CoA dioxygenase family)
VDHAISCIWALDGEFSEERGTTRVVPGSHDWPKAHTILPLPLSLSLPLPRPMNPVLDQARTARPEESIPAVMARGSVLVYTGRTMHGAGHNQSDSPRVALNVAYNSACLKQEAAQP